MGSNFSKIDICKPRQLVVLDSNLSWHREDNCELPAAITIDPSEEMTQSVWWEVAHHLILTFHLWMAPTAIACLILFLASLSGLCRRRLESVCNGAVNW